jgi:hypothetical protein
MQSIHVIIPCHHPSMRSLILFHCEGYLLARASFVCFSRAQPNKNSSIGRSVGTLHQTNPNPSIPPEIAGSRSSMPLSLLAMLVNSRRQIESFQTHTIPLPHERINEWKLSSLPILFRWLFVLIVLDILYLPQHVPLEAEASTSSAMLQIMYSYQDMVVLGLSLLPFVLYVLPADRL